MVGNVFCMKRKSRATTVKPDSLVFIFTFDFSFYKYKCLLIKIIGRSEKDMVENFNIVINGFLICRWRKYISNLFNGLWVRSESLLHYYKLTMRLRAISQSLCIWTGGGIRAFPFSWYVSLCNCFTFRKPLLFHL